MSQKLLKSEKKMSRSEAAEKIRGIADKINEGEITLKAGEESVTLNPSEQLEFEIEVEKERDGEMSLELEIEWKEGNENQKIEIQ